MLENRLYFGEYQVRNLDEIKVGMKLISCYGYLCVDGKPFRRSIQVVEVVEEPCEKGLGCWWLEVKKIFSDPDRHQIDTISLSDKNVMPYKTGMWNSFNWLEHYRDGVIEDKVGAEDEGRKFDFATQEPKIVSYVQCGICNGKLEEFTKTRHSFGTACGDGGTNAEFWKCDKCDTIYYRHRYSSGSYLNTDPDGYSDFIIFKLQATREELQILAPACSGYYGDYNDNRIIGTREQKLSILSDLEKKFRSLKNIASLNVLQSQQVCQYPRRIGNSDLGAFSVILEGKETYAWCKLSSGIKKGEEVILIIEEIDFSPYSSQKTIFAIKI